MGTEWHSTLTKAIRNIIGGDANYENADKTLEKGQIFGSKVPDWR